MTEHQKKLIDMKYESLAVWKAEALVELERLTTGDDAAFVMATFGALFTLVTGGPDSELFRNIRRAIDAQKRAEAAAVEQLSKTDPELAADAATEVFDQVRRCGLYQDRGTAETMHFRGRVVYPPQMAADIEIRKRIASLTEALAGEELAVVEQVATRLADPRSVRRERFLAQLRRERPARQARILAKQGAR